MDERRAAIRQVLLVLAVALPIALLGALSSAGFFTAYEGTAVGWRPLPGEDGVEDRLQRWVIVDDAGRSSEVVLPTAAFSGRRLPLAAAGVPPATRPEDATPVRKSRFTLSAVVGTRSWTTLTPAHVLLPLLALVAAVAVRNVIMTGSALRLVPEGGSALPGVSQPPPNQPVKPPTPPKPGKGPPPSGGGGKRKRGRPR